MKDQEFEEIDEFGKDFDDDTLYTDEELGISVDGIEDLTEDEEETTTGGASVTQYVTNYVNKTCARNNIGVYVPLKGYRVQSYFNCNVTPRNAQIGYSHGNKWVIRKPYASFHGTIRASIIVQADSNYARNRRKMQNIITVKCY